MPPSMLVRAPRRSRLGAAFVLGAVLSAVGLSVVVAAPVSTTFAFTAGLGAPNGSFNGPCDLRFRLFDTATAGSQVGPTVERADVPISNGRFTTTLDFGDVFQGDARFVEIAARCPAADTGPFTTNANRVELRATPHALFARLAGALRNFPLSATTPVANQVLKFDGTKWVPAQDPTAAGVGLTKGGDTIAISSSFRLPQNCPARSNPRWTGSAWVCGAVPARTGKLTLLATAFAPKKHSYNYVQDATGLHKEPDAAGNLRQDWSAQVQLPNGAKVTRFRSTYCDDDPNRTLFVHLVRVDPRIGYGSDETLASANSNTQSACALVRDPAGTNFDAHIEHPFIDTGKYGYYVGVQFPDGNTRLDLELHSVEIEYELP
jgi:hypothetical protein